MNKKKPFKVFATDILTIDHSVKLSESKTLQDLAAQLGASAGSKIPLDNDQFNQLIDAVGGLNERKHAGGSSANTLTTLSKLMEGDVKVDFLGSIGTGEYSRMVQSAMDSAGVNLIRAKLPEGLQPQLAHSYVLLRDDGDRSIFTHPGNIRQVMKKENLKPDTIEKYDAVMVQGKLWERMDWDFVDQLLIDRWDARKELWLTLPEVTKFGKHKDDEKVENKDFYRWLTMSANLVLANVKELACVEGVVDAKVKESDMTRAQKNEAAQRLVDAFAYEGERFPNKNLMPNAQRQVGFITDGEHGSYVVTKDGYTFYKTEPLAEREIVNKLGTGDTAFAGFIYGYLHGMSYENCARIGMKLATSKMREDGPRLKDPVKALNDAMPHLGHLLGDSTVPLEMGHAK